MNNADIKKSVLLGIVLGIIAGFLLILVIIMFIFLLHISTERRIYTKEVLEEGLISVEFIYIKNYENRCNYDLIAELSDDDVKYVMERITQIHFVEYSPRSSESVYGIKFCYKDESLVFEPNNIVRIDNNGEKVEGTKWFCMRGPEELMNLIDELVDKYLDV